ncbi:hypothetical protein [Gallaecimonas sp. GXIMD4217]|uniref:hypothetical protein n=1 Tax=Gallaecimonas sp. GXIMD4217 TaxID=3131927 RepID=UPI00311B2D4E
MRALIERLGSRPRLAARRFFTGLLLFLAGLALILAGSRFDPLLQVPGLIIGGAGMLLALSGYVGILCHRLGQFLAR